MRTSTLLSALLAAAMPSATARAVIRVDIPLSKVHATAESVLVGTVERTSAGNRVAEVRVTDVLKGAGGDRLRVQVASPAELFKSVAVGQPVVLFVGGEKATMAVVHLADTWLLAEAVPNVAPPIWRVGQVHGIRETFPGRTAALADVLRRAKDGKLDLLEEIDHDVFRGGVRPLGRLDVTRPTFLRVADVNGDRKPDLLVGAGGGVRLFLAGDKSYTDATAAWGLDKAAGTIAAFGDVNADGKPDLLLGKGLFTNAGGRFVPAEAPLEAPLDAKILAAALTDLTGDGRADAAFLTVDGRLAVLVNPGAPGKRWMARPARPLWKGGEPAWAAEFGHYGDNGRPHVMVLRANGATRYPLDDDGQAADHQALTGKPVGSWHREHRDGLEGLFAAGIDVNADGRRDLLILAVGGGLLMVNRGAGSFLVNPDAAEPLYERQEHSPPLKLATAVACAADVKGDGREDLLVLAADGRLLIADNTPPDDGPPGSK